MKAIEFLLLAFCVLITFKASAMSITTGQGYYTYNGQVIGYYHLKPGNYPDPDVHFVETKGDNPPINEAAACRYYQQHNSQYKIDCH